MQEDHEFDHLQEGHFEKSGTGYPTGHLQEWADHPNSKTKSDQNVNQYYSDDYEEYITLHEGILLTLNTRHDSTFHMQEHIEQPVLQDTQTQNQPQGNSSDDSEEYFFIGRLRSLVVRALERYSKDPGSSPGGDACFSH